MSRHKTGKKISIIGQSLSMCCLKISFSRSLSSYMGPVLYIPPRMKKYRYIYSTLKRTSTYGSQEGHTHLDCSMHAVVQVGQQV